MGAFTDKAAVAAPYTCCKTDPHHETELLMPYVLIIHEVQDYAVWTDIFD
jgi:hypothetical protein